VRQEYARRDSNPQPSVPKTDDSNPQPKDSISGCDDDEKRLARALHSVSSTDVDLQRVVAATSWACCFGDMHP